jgi:hypothetical protein
MSCERCRVVKTVAGSLPRPCRVLYTARSLYQKSPIKLSEGIGNAASKVGHGSPRLIMQALSDLFGQEDKKPMGAWLGGQSLFWPCLVCSAAAVL